MRYLNLRSTGKIARTTPGACCRFSVCGRSDDWRCTSRHCYWKRCSGFDLCYTLPRTELTSVENWASANLSHPETAEFVSTAVFVSHSRCLRAALRNIHVPFLHLQRHELAEDWQDSTGVHRRCPIVPRVHRNYSIHLYL